MYYIIDYLFYKTLEQKVKDYPKKDQNKNSNNKKKEQNFNIFSGRKLDRKFQIDEEQKYSDILDIM